jgi:DNA polymerase-3 subunit epsilon
LDPATARTIEVGCVLFDIAHATPIASFASLFYAPTNDAEKINHISTLLLADYAQVIDGWGTVRALAESADAILAHSAQFDRGFVPVDLRDSKPWICTKDDLEWPRATKPGQSLVTLALDHGLGVATAHRALADCDLIARLLSRAAEFGTDLPAFLARGLRPKATYQALVSYDDRELAKAAGFSWDGTSRRWTRRMCAEDTASMPFPMREVMP